MILVVLVIEDWVTTLALILVLNKGLSNTHTFDLISEVRQ